MVELTVQFMTSMGLLLFPILFAVAGTATNTGSCKDMLQGYITGQLSSALGAYQVEALRREFKTVTDQIEKSVNKMEEKTGAAISRHIVNRNSSIVYTRWGKKTCPSTTELVISGYTGGSYYGHTAAVVDPLCLPRDPEWGVYTDGTDGYKAFVYGAEYETISSAGSLQALHNHDVPCAVCLARNKSVVKMFPARKTCYKGWNLEYHGYLMAGYYNYQAGSVYTCVDSHPDTLHGGKADKNGYLFHQVEARCGSLKCPPYVEGRELVCAVCSKA